MLLVIDNYDSFTYNLVQYCEQYGFECLTMRNDQLSLEDIERLGIQACIVSPGPSSPDNAGICLDYFREFSGRIPTLGICLGMQAMAQAFGGNIERAPELKHGKASPIDHNGAPLFTDIPSPFYAGRYHSLAVNSTTLPNNFSVDATLYQSSHNMPMAISDKERQLYGVQFHPESILTQCGHQILANFFSLSGLLNEHQRSAVKPSPAIAWENVQPFIGVDSYCDT